MRAHIVKTCKIGFWSRGFKTSTTLHKYDLEEKPLFASVTSPFIYSDFDVKYHRRALGCIPDTTFKNEESSLTPHPLFGLIPAQHSILANIKRLAKELHIDLSTLKLKEHFIRFKASLPGSGTVICRTRLRDVTGSFCTKNTNIIIEVELWSTEANLQPNKFLMFNQFCYSGIQNNSVTRKKFSNALRKLSWPPMLDAVPDYVIRFYPTWEKQNQLLKVGKDNRFPKDPMLLHLCSWRQEQLEGVGIITLIVEDIIKKLGIHLHQVIIVKTSLFPLDKRLKAKFGCRMGSSAKPTHRSFLNLQYEQQVNL